MSDDNRSSPEVMMPSAEQVTKLKENIQPTGCCGDTACKCDDSCLDKLARAICANDDGHIHGCNAKNGTDTCECDATDTASVNSRNAEVVQPPAVDTPAIGGDSHACGLRQRKKTQAMADLPVACGEHKSIAVNRYSETLTLFGCICKAMLARGLESCCVNQGAAKYPRSSSYSRKSLLRNDSRRSSCCDSHHSSRAKSVRSHASLGIPSQSASKASVDSCCGDSCCGGGLSIRSVRREDAASQRPTVRPSIDSCCGDSCCGGGGDTDDEAEAKSCGGEGSCCEKRAPSICQDSCCGDKEGDVDIEKQTTGIHSTTDPSSLNHATIAVKGMTCTGCENKLIRALQAIPAIRHFKTSLVLARAEFDYNGAEEDLKTLIEVIEKRTGFSAEEVVPTSSHVLDLSVDADLLEKLCLAPFPDGVKGMVRVNRTTIRVLHEPEVIGSRDIISAYGDFSPVLAPVPKNPALVAGLKHLHNLAFRTITSAILTIPVLIMTWAPLPAHPKAYAIASLVLATIVQTAIAGPFYYAAFKSLFFSRIVEIDLLIVLSTTTAYVYSVVAFAFEMIGKPLPTGEFFETSTLLVTLIMVGQLVSAFARHRAIEAISIRSLQHNTAILVHKDGAEEEIDGRLLQFGDTFKVHPDSSIITDGTVTQGQSEVDESMMTGEALPVLKQSGSTVIAGTSNGPGVLFVKVTRLPGSNTISDIAERVDDARLSRAKIQDIADVVCGWFVPVVLTLAIITFTVWIIIGLKVRAQKGGAAAVTALTYAIAVLAVSCPCAIGLAVPMVILIASGVAAKHGLIFKSATTIETARNINHVVFDKTGTLTKGKLSVVESIILDEDVSEVHSLILALVASSKHPVARAVAEKLQTEGTQPRPEIDNVKVIVGKGVTGSCKDGKFSGGNAHWLGVENHEVVRPILEKGLTTFCVTLKDRLLAVFALTDTLRPEAIPVISSLRARGIEVSILSGDHAASVDHVASQLGISRENIRSGCLPADKQAYIRELTNQGKKVLFCGDGTNDAIALAQADVGVHMHEEASSGIAASSAADVVLIRPSLTGILTLLELSNSVHKRIVLNFVWSAVYNTVAILFAAGAFVDARIAPAYAGLGEIVSVVPVVLIAMQLMWFKGEEKL